MNAVLKSFEYEGSPVRVVTIDERPWWVATDLAALLGYGHVPHMLRILEDDQKGVHLVDTLGGEQSLTIVTEGGMWTCVLRSKRPEAKRFVRWLTDVLLPTLRRTGRYELPGVANDEAGEVYLGSAEEIERSRAIMLEVKTAERLYGKAGGRQIWEIAGKPIPHGMLTIAAAQSTAHPLVAAWFDQRAERVAGARTRSADVHEDFLAFCSARAASPLSMKALADEIGRLGFERRKSNEMWWIGLRLRGV